MCGRFALTTDAGVVGRRFGAPPAEGGGTLPPASVEIAPTQLVVTVTDDGQRHLEPMKWGLVPRWAKALSIGSRLINARAETLAEKPAFREALKYRRCLIPADAFYEWATGPDGRKHPLRLALVSGEPFAFAGLWEEWQPPEGGAPLRTCTIVTTTPNELMATFHHRMPVILTPEGEQRWLDPTLQEPEQVLPLLESYPAGAMVCAPATELERAPKRPKAQLALALPE